MSSPPRYIHYTALAPADPSNELYRETETYRREVGRLLAEGHAGQWVLIKGDEILGVWDTDDAALAEGYRRFLLQPFYVQQVQEYEKVYFQRTAYW